MSAPHALIIGAGLAGAAAASALARRGWRVQVLDAASAPAAGASGLPAGLMAPHLSADDGLLSRLTRLGAQATRAELERLTACGLLEAGQDWCCDGALEHRIRSSRPPALPEADSGGSRPATTDELAAASLPSDAAAVWHPMAGWVKPGALVRAWLSEPGITFHGDARVDVLRHLQDEPAVSRPSTPLGAQPARKTGPTGSPGTANAWTPGHTPGSRWQALDAQGRLLGEAPLAVVAAALGSAPLLHGRLRLQPVRGQVSWGLRTPGDRLPAFPVNGNGHLLTAVPVADGLAWLSGSAYGHGETDTTVRPEDHAANLARIRALLPSASADIAQAFDAGTVRAWTGVRCASTDRRPLVGAVGRPGPLGPVGHAAEGAPGLWALTALGSRGLTLSALCAALLAARVMGEPPPLPDDLAAALDLARQRSDADLA